MPGPYSSFGTLLQLGDGGGPETFATVGEVGDISGPEMSTDTEETTNQSSPGGKEQFIGTIKRTGEITFPVNFDPSNPTHDEVTGLVKAWNDRRMANWRMILPTTPTRRWAFTALITGLSQEADVAGILRFNVTLKPSGDILLQNHP